MPFEAQAQAAVLFAFGVLGLLWLWETLSRLIARPSGAGRVVTLLHLAGDPPDAEARLRYACSLARAECARLVILDETLPAGAARAVLERFARERPGVLILTPKALAEYPDTKLCNILQLIL